MNEKLEICEICKRSIKEIKKELNLFGYDNDALKEHVENEHHLIFEDYLDEYTEINVPLCSCGCGEKVKANTGSKYIQFNRMIKNHFVKKKENDFELKRCEICGESISVIKEKLDVKGYDNDALKEHVENEHHLIFEDYLDEYTPYTVPLCSCGCGQKVHADTGSRFIKFPTMKLGHLNCKSSEKFAKSVEKEKIERLGKGNPMFGKKPWNFEMTKENNQSVFNISRKMSGRKLSEEHIDKIRENHKKGLYKNFNHCKPHTEETKRRLSQKTLEQLRMGKVKQTRTKIHLKFCEFLKEEGIEFVEEKYFGRFSFDIYLVKNDIYIELDGDYWHSNPKFYPDGPKTYSQKSNWKRDIEKKKYAEEKGLIVIHFWEDEINNDFDKVKDKFLKFLKDKNEF